LRLNLPSKPDEKWPFLAREKQRADRGFGSPEAKPLAGGVVVCLTTTILPRQTYDGNGRSIGKKQKLR